MSAERDVLGTARLAVGCAAWLLPTPADRRRYQAEFVAELYGLPASDQWRHTVGILSQAFALRAALGGTSTRSEEVVMQSTTAGQRFRCRHLHWHHWKVFSAQDGARYSACTVCHKEHGDWLNAPNIIGGG